MTTLAELYARMQDEDFAVTPKGAAGEERLDAYWTEGKGAALINWAAPCAFCRCKDAMMKHAVPHGMDPAQVPGHCHNLEVRATGHRPNVENSHTKHCPC